MTLLAVRTKFVQLSGRYDLVVDSTSYVDNGANFFINDGMSMLDKLVTIPASIAKLYYSLTAGSYSLTFQNSCRAIQEVWANDGTSRWQLEKKTLNEIKTYYNETATATEKGRPTYFAPAELRALETTDQTTLGTFINKTWAETETKYDYRGIIITPPVDKTYTIEISGLFKNVKLTTDADENFWTLQEEGLLLRAALYKLEVFSRGTENAKNWLSAIQDDVRLIEFDNIEEESYNITQMEG